MPKLKRTPAKMLRAWRMKEKGHTFNEIGDTLGINKDTASRWCFLVESDPELLATAQGKTIRKVEKKSNGTTKRVNLKPFTPDQETMLRDEVVYLRWWNSGERAGFVERLLKELQEK